MKSANLAAAVLLLGTTACATGLGPVAEPSYAVGPGRTSTLSTATGNAAPEGGNESAWADAALSTAPVSVPALDASDVGDGIMAAAAPWDIAVTPYVGEDRVEHFVRVFSGSARGHFTERLRRGTRYEGMIRGKLRAGGLPEDLFYLALVESGFEQHAYSRAAAVGMWQFMTTTARAVGLRVDWWVDERRDPVRSTDAAVRHLRGLRTEFDGSVYLAAAAYNGGSGRIGRLLAQHEAARGAEGEDRFFALAGTGDLRKETSDYVPQLIAAALIAKSPAVYGIAVEPLAPYAYDSLRVDGGTPLAAVAAAAEVPLAAVLDLNGHFLRGVTPPGTAALVRVPVGTGAGLEGRLAELPEEARTAFTRVETEDRGRLSAIAREHGLEERQVAVYNPGLKRHDNGLLVGGQTVLVPSRAVLAAALDVADPEVERYGTSTAAVAAAPRPKPPRKHTVAPGDALERIAREYDLDVAELRRLNDLDSDVIRPGQELLVEGGTRPAAKAKGTKAKSTSKAKSAKVASAKSKKAKPTKPKSTKANSAKAKSTKAKAKKA